MMAITDSHRLKFVLRRVTEIKKVFFFRMVNKILEIKFSLLIKGKVRQLFKNNDKENLLLYSTSATES